MQCNGIVQLLPGCTEVRLEPCTYDSPSVIYVYFNMFTTTHIISSAVSSAVKTQVLQHSVECVMCTCTYV